GLGTGCVVATKTRPPGTRVGVSVSSLHTRNDMLPAAGPLAADHEFTNRSVSKHGAVCPECLYEDLFPVRDEENRRLCAVCFLNHPAVEIGRASCRERV